MVDGSTVNTYPPLCESLSQLQDAADHIFDAIINRVGLEHQQLSKLSARILSAQAKVDAISGTKRATTIYSSAKFPRVDPSVVDFVPLFEGAKGRQGQRFAHTVSLNTGHWQSQEEGSLELFQFFSETSHEYWLKDHKHQDGVGKVPPAVKSVADVLLFNSTELPYHKYRIVDNLAGAGPNEEELEVKPSALPAAPQSVLVGDVVTRPGSEEYGFRPVLRQVPSFSLPAVLPDLPMIAEISWSGMSGGINQMSSIAPSAGYGGSFSPRSNYSATPRFDSGSVSTRFEPTSPPSRLNSASLATSLNPGAVLRRSDPSSENGSFRQHDPSSQILPLLNIQPIPKDTNSQAKISRSMSGESSSGSTKSISSLPPLPPLHPFSRHQSVEVQAQKDRIPLPPLPPPPPPRPPSLPPSPAKVIGVQNKSLDQPPLPPIDSQRMALMASIRNSGLDLLRKTGRSEFSNPIPPLLPSQTGKNEVEGLDNTSPVDVKKPINVMAEMARSLTLRRLSMRGASHDQGARRIESSNTPTNDEGRESDGPSNYSKERLPNLQTLIAKRSHDQSDDDDDDWV